MIAAEMLHEDMALSPQREADVSRVVDEHLGLVLAVAKGYNGCGVPLPDLVQEGCIGLMIAARKFDPAMGCKFSTYATKWIRHGVTRCIQKHSGIIRVSQRTQDKARKIRLAQQELGEEATMAAVAQRCGMTVSQVEKTLALLPEVFSLDDGPAQELLGELQVSQPQEKLMRRELQTALGKLMEQLTPRQNQVLRLRFGLDDGVCHTHENIGKILGISKERARQVEHEAVAKLQKLSAGTGLEDYLDP